MTAPLGHLDLLEAESIHIFREAAAQFRAPVLLYSIGKDSTVLLHLARKAFYPAKPPFPLLHVDTTWKFRDMIAFRDRTARELGLELIVHTNQDGRGARHQSRSTTPPSTYTDVMKTQALRQALDKHGFDAAFGGARRDEEASRAKERVFSFRAGRPPLEPAQAAPGDVAPAQRPPRRRRDRAHLPALQLDREGRVALHRPRAARRGAALLRRRAARPSSATAACWCSTTTACRCARASRSDRSACASARSAAGR